jgi:vacuolar-type H+-ATPase catalytic subunit A/Vma1
MVPVHSIETMLSRNAPWLRDAFLAHSQARLAPHYLPAVVAKVGNYYTRAGRNGYYDPTRVSQAVRQAVGSNAIGLHRGLISNTTVINRVLTALDKLK